ncbi:gamma-secretase aspartyl protease complex, presenilin enhancer-2 subunit [Pilobolus umbonatus]|nr:gamma-secretase aspartyl protease complex, presenilin enhancer-2 subunit [Pilobolus umbonatus]
MPQVDKMSTEEHISISRKMFYGGFAFLPFLWLVNYMYFFKLIHKPNAPAEFKKYVYLSLGGCIVWFILLTTWYILYVTQRISWGEMADIITVIIPKGV